MKSLFAFICLSFLLNVSGCYCWQTAHEQEKQCVVEHQVVDCTTSNILAAIPHLIPIALELLSGQSPDWESLLTSLESSGWKDANCTLAVLENDLATKASVSSLNPKMLAVHTNLKSYKLKHMNEGIKFKILVDGKVVVR